MLGLSGSSRKIVCIIAATLAAIDGALLHQAVRLYLRLPSLPDLYGRLYTPHDWHRHRAESSAAFLFGFPLAAIMASQLIVRAWYRQENDHDPRITRNIVFSIMIFAVFAIGAQMRFAAVGATFGI